MRLAATVIGNAESLGRNRNEQADMQKRKDLMQTIRTLLLTVLDASKIGNPSTVTLSIRVNGLTADEAASVTEIGEKNKELILQVIFSGNILKAIQDQPSPSAPADPEF